MSFCSQFSSRFATARALTTRGQGRFFEVEEYSSWGCGVNSTGLVGQTGLKLGRTPLYIPPWPRTLHVKPASWHPATLLKDATCGNSTRSLPIIVLGKVYRKHVHNQQAQVHIHDMPRFSIPERSGGRSYGCQDDENSTCNPFAVQKSFIRIDQASRPIS